MNALPDLDAPRAVKLTVTAFEMLHRSGFLDDHRRAELIDGNITEMSPLGMRHALVQGGLLFRLMEKLQPFGTDMRALPAPTIAMPPHDAPEPDIVIARIGEPADGYVPREAVMLVVEVAVSTLRYDLDEKRALYARAMLPEYWVVDVDGGEVHQFWSPLDNDYREGRVVTLAGELRSATLPALAIDGAGIL